MSKRLLKLSKRIQSEVVDLESVIDRIKEGWQRSMDSGDDYYLDSVVLNYLHSLTFCKMQHKKAKAQIILSASGFNFSPMSPFHPRSAI